MRRGSFGIAFGGVILLGLTLAACTSTGGTAARATWESSSSFVVLDSIPATAESRYSVSLVDVTALNRLDRFAEQPLSTTTEAGSSRPPAESAWWRYALSSASCTGLVESGRFGSGTSVRTAPLDETVNIGFGDFDPPALLSVCQGAVDPAQLPSVLGDGWTDSAVAGVPGMQTEQFWVGYQPDVQRTTMIGTDVPDNAAAAVLTSTPVVDSLAADTGVRAVLAAAPVAATIEMGTFLLALGKIATDDPDVDTATDAAQQQVGSALPTPVFAGFGWTPGALLDGTATFVTTYASEAQAVTAGSVLTDIWPRLGQASGPMSRATTSVSGSVVVTEIAAVPADQFDLQNLRLADYPGCGAG